MLVECNHCGAPLDIAPGARVVACAYCHRQHRVPRMKTLAPDTPSDWKPPEVWTPPAEATARSRPMRFHPVKVIAGLVFTVGRLIGMLLSLAVLAPALYFLYQELRPLAQPEVASAVGGGADGLGKLAKQVLTQQNLDKVADAVNKLGEGIGAGGSWDGKEPFTCAGNDRVTLEGVTAQLPGRTAVTVEANCELQLIDCTIEAWEGVSVSGNARVLVERSRIDAKGVGIDVEGNAHLELVESTLEAGDVGVRGSHNARVVLGSGRVAGKQAALVLKHNGRAEVREAEVVGKVDARRGRVEGLERRK